MVVRVRSVASLAALTIAAWPSPAHAQEPSSPTPNLRCTSATGAPTGGDGGTVSTINWGDNFSLGAPTVFVDGSLQGMQFGCGNNMYSTQTFPGSMFEVNFGTPGSIPPGDVLKLELDTVTYTKEKKFVTEFDMYADFLKTTIDGGSVVEQKHFVGLKVESDFGDSKITKLNSLFIDTSNKALILDPSIPAGPNGSIESATLELINTPGGPASTPEPATFTLFGTGLLAAARVLRRKSRR
jgi:hypothetical protein